MRLSPTDKKKLHEGFRKGKEGKTYFKVNGLTIRRVPQGYSVTDSQGEETTHTSIEAVVAIHASQS